LRSLTNMAQCQHDISETAKETRCGKKQQEAQHHHAGNIKWSNSKEMMQLWTHFAPICRPSAREGL